jgi:hypothetical protein
MSSQFSYELDERQIRLMMQDAELDYNEAMWHKFDEMSATQARTSSNIGNYIPSINFGISRSIIVPQKKKKKIKTEVLPTINATAPNLNEGASEPELDLK